MNIAVCVICVVLMILGASELLRLLVFWWTGPLTRTDFSLVVAPKNAEDCECTVRAAAERIRWLDLKGSCRIICVNKSEDPEIDRICRFLMLRYPYLRVSKIGDLVYDCMEKDEYDSETLKG